MSDLLCHKHNMYKHKSIDPHAPGLYLCSECEKETYEHNKKLRKGIPMPDQILEAAEMEEKKIHDRLDKLEISEKDVVILKGEWQQEELQAFAELCAARNMNNILIVVPDEKSLDTMPIDDFYFMLKEVEKKREEIDKETTITDISTAAKID